MKKRLLTLVSCLLVVAMCVALLAACVVIEDDTVGAEFENFVYNYGNITTKNSTYTVPNKIDTLDSKGGDAVIYVKWEKGGNDANLVTLTEGEDETTVSLPNLSGQISYTLTATFVNAKGKEYLDSNKNPYSHTFTCNVTLGSSSGGGGGQQGGDTPTDGNGTQSSPYTVAQALAATPSSGYSSEVYVKGVVSGSVTAGNSGDLKFNMVDAGSSTTLYVYFATPTASGSSAIADGDTVVVKGALTTYNSTKELTFDKTGGVTCEIVSFVKGTGGGQQGGGQQGGDTSDLGTFAGQLSLAGVATRTKFDDAQIVHSANDITYTYTKGSATTANYDNTGHPDWATRAYAAATFTITYKSAIKAIVIECDSGTYSGKTYYSGMDGMTVSGTTITVNGATTTVVLNTPDTTFTTAALLSQMRILSIKIYV